MDKEKIVLVTGHCSSTIGQRVKMIIEEKLNEQVHIANSFSQSEPMIIKNTHISFTEFFKPPVSRKERRKQERKLKKKRK